MARKTKEEAEATRESILDAAEHVFMEKGVAQASLEQIARAAGVTRGAIYWHFRNKQDILDAMLERVRGPLGEMLTATGDEGGLEGLKALCVTALSNLAEDEQFFRVYYVLFHRNESDQALAKHRALADEAMTFLSELFNIPSNRQQLRPGLAPEHAAYLVHTQMLGLFFDWLAKPARWPLAEIAPKLVDSMFHGIVAGD